MAASGGHSIPKAQIAVVFAALAVISLIWLGVAQFVDLPFTFSSREYSAAVFPALGFGLLATFAGGFSWIDFGLEPDNREVRMAQAAMVIGILVVLITVVGLVLPLALRANLSST